MLVKYYTFKTTPGPEFGYSTATYTMYTSNYIAFIKGQHELSQI